MDKVKKDKIKKKKVREIIVIIFVCLILFGFSYYFGVNNGLARARKNSLDSEIAAINTDRIAIVNADQGIMINGEIINYAALFITSLNDNYIMENLEAARKGMENGTYAAYILIPSTFSESVISLNSTPKQAKIEYAINANLTEERKIEAIYNIVNFEHILNCKMSYMYIDSILKEFHAVQDGAEEIMNHDARDTEALLAIQPYDIISMVSVSELEYVDYSMESMDVSQYNKSNEEIVENIWNQYVYYISLSETEKEALRNQGDILIQQWKVSEAEIANMNLTVDDNGSVIYEVGLNNIANELDYYNESLREAEYNIVDDLNEIKGMIDSANVSLEDAIRIYNDKIQTENTETAQQIYQNITENLLPSISGKENELIIGDEVISVPYIGGSAEEAEEKYNRLVEYFIQVDQMIGDSSYSELSELQHAYAEYLKDNEEVNDILDECKTDCIFQVDTDALADALERAVSKSVSEDESQIEEIEKIIKQNQPLFYDQIVNINGEMEESGETIDTVGGLLTRAGELVQENLNHADELAIPRINADTMQTMIEDEIVQPLDVHSNAIQENLLEQFRNEEERFTEYNRAYMAYNPMEYVNRVELQALVNDISSNNFAIQSAVTRDHMQNMEYVAAVNRNAEHNISTLRQDLLDANIASNEAVSNALAEVKNLKSETRELNQTILQSFTSKLSYTRLGNRSNTDVYAFIANPSTLVDVSEGEYYITGNSYQSTYSSFETGTLLRGEGQNRTILILGLICITVGIVTFVVWRYWDKKKESKQLQKIY